ncbi:MAG: diacylglycerol kinase family protein [Chloroflexota bacterium]
MTDRALLLIVNPVSGGKPGSTVPLSNDPAKLEPEAVAEGLRSRGLRVRRHVLSENDDPAEVARDTQPGEDVVVAGGDGTVGPVAETLTGTDRALGILAMGSWNNIARALGIPMELEAALDVIGRGQVSKVDAGLAWRTGAEEDPPGDARLFFEAAGVGLDAAGFGAIELGGRAGWRFAARAMWRALRRRRTRMLIELDGEVLQRRAPAVTVCIGPYHGMGFALVPDADPADGLFDIAVFSRMSELDVVRHFLAVARGRERHEPRIELLRGKRITVRGAQRVLPAHADGGSIGATPVTFQIQPGSLRVFR